MNARCSGAGSFPVTSVISQATKATIAAPPPTAFATMLAQIARMPRKNTAKRFSRSRSGMAMTTG